MPARGPGSTWHACDARRRGATCSSTPDTFRFPGGGESFEEARDRSLRELHAIARAHRRGRVVVATHGDILRVMLTELAGAPLRRFQGIVVDTASVSVVTIDGRSNTRILLVNDTGDLLRFGPDGGTPAWEAAAPRRGSRRKPNLRG